MAKFPEPPSIDYLKNITPEIYTLSADTVVTRIYFAAGAYPTSWHSFRYYGPTASRFDHHLCDAHNKPHMQERGIMYLTAGTQAIPTALAEVFQGTRVIDRRSRNPILTGFNLKKTIKLLNLRGAFVTTIGALTAIHSGQRGRARRWAQQLYLAYPELEGIYYCSSMNGNEPVIALFERAQKALPERPIFHRELRDPTLATILTETAEKIRYVLV